MTVSPKLPSESLDPRRVASLQLGVWSVLLPNDASPFKLGFSRSTLPSMEKLSAFANSYRYPVLARFFRDVYTLQPALTLFYLAMKLWTGMESVLLLYASGKLLRVVEVGLRDGNLDARAVIQAILVRILCTLMVATTKWGREYISPRLKSRIKLHFENQLLRADLRLDIPTSEDSQKKSRPSAEEAWHAFQVLGDVAQRVFILLSELLFISQQRSGGYVFTAISLLYPLMNLRARRTLFLMPHLVYSDNAPFRRLKALNMMTKGQSRADIVLGGMADWIGSEYRRARDLLGSTPTDQPWAQYSVQRTPFAKMAADLVGQLPTIYWAVSALLRPSQFSMASIAILTQYSTSVSNTVQMLFWEYSQTAKSITDVNALYDAEKVQNLIVDGKRTYPRPEWEWHSERGMDVQLRRLIPYPGTKSTVNALRGVSLHIPAGALAVVVGANGSGKSTLIKLLARLYDADSTGGEILIDGLPIREYKLADLRRAQAHLAQDNQLFPVPLWENIGLGAVSGEDSGSFVFDKAAVRAAAEAGGASALVDRLKDGIETVLTPVPTAYERLLDDERHKDLKEFLSTLEKPAEVSGGEKQRLVASRTFMRLQLPDIKLLCVDEPSSALDPLGEFELFQRLRESGTGTTKIFVTHRFGHLTKHADVIICMKEGTIAEMGSHRELLALGGEYAALYNVQAQAFTDTDL
ncbi:P-loop containing nucleoside triphosphate hydrolase protein [Mycena amicta]|nr:P-loop containing nucleoside triphosphate hydrolase protein [Mycena amicta]